MSSRGTRHGTLRERTGETDIIKLGAGSTRTLPWDVRADYAGHPTFPHDGTMKQLAGAGLAEGQQSAEADAAQPHIADT